MPKRQAREPTEASHVVRLRMRFRREAVAPTVDRILKAVGPAGFTPSQCEDLAVALSEALANAAVHGNGLRPRSFIDPA